MTNAPASMPAWARPIRMPKAITLTHADPPLATAGALGEWRLPFRISRDVPPGSALKLQLWGGRNNRGEFSLQTDDPAREGYLTVALAGGRRLVARCEKEGSGMVAIELPAEGLRKGRRLTVVLGDRSGGGPGSRAPLLRLLNKMAVLYHIPPERSVPSMPQWTGGSVWASGTEDLLLAVCTLHVLGGPVHHLRAYGPAFARPNEPFRLLVRPEDEWDNLASRAPGDLAVTLEGAPVPAVFEAVEDSTCREAMVALAGEGVVRLNVREAGTGRQAVAPPLVCSVDARPIYWGMIHGHTEMSDGTGTLDQYFRQLRNEVRLDFAATGDHDHLWETSDAFWIRTGRAVRRWHAPGAFVTFPGYEWAKWRRNGDGDRNVYYLRDGRPMYRSDEGHCATPPALFHALREHKEKAIVIPHHTGHEGNFCDWKDHDPDAERLVEIFQVRGSYECSEAAGNPAPERDKRYAPHEEGFVCRALELGWRVGFTAGGDDHEGAWGTERRAYPDLKTSYKQGAMSVEAGALTRKAVFQALYDRRVVATTGARLLLTYRLNGKPMGSECSLKADSALAGCRDLAVSFHGTAPLKRLDIIRNNKVVHTVAGAGRLDVALAWSDTQPLEETWLPAARYCDHPFTFYYVRAVQADGEAAWASPVWIDS